ncbi:CoA transferase [Limnohabitans sp. Jir61]|uniref:CaiB/BaiF CoA transferase family protein n=1 Tax=Limnohabitans sp. Jir61 TaxID=1826168 RepID=UPI000D35AE70|nr:CoA transferase [Limnohabitans sp. Jir61]PUE30897.1 CoA transferase [Limnohabitans sp. Jir61]
MNSNDHLAQNAGTHGALAGLRVIDMTGVVLGPYATQILGDYGADVIKIEPPSGDIMRHAGPMKHPGMGHIFINANRNKRSVVLDLKKPEQREQLLALCKTADVLVYNIRPAAMARLGLSFDTLHAVNPRLVVCGAYGYSEGGPYSDWPAYDDLIQGAVGMPWLMTQSGSTEPRYAPTTFADRVTGLNMVHAVMAAIIARYRTGVGQHVEVPMFECLLQFVLGDHLCGETWQPSLGNMGYARLLAVNRKPYATQDGHICALMYNDAHWQAFLKLVGVPDLFQTDTRFATHAERLKNIDALYGVVGQHMRKRTTAEWMKDLTTHDIPVMPMMKLDDLLTDPHLTATQGWLDVPHPFEGMLRQLRPPVRMSGTPTGVWRPAPRLGEHTEEVLSELSV